MLLGAIDMHKSMCVCVFLPVFFACVGVCVHLHLFYSFTVCCARMYDTQISHEM